MRYSLNKLSHLPVHIYLNSWRILVFPIHNKALTISMLTVTYVKSAAKGQKETLWKNSKFSPWLSWQRTRMPMQETQEITWVWFLGWQDPTEKEMATHSSILPWEIPWTEEPGELQSMGSTDHMCMHTHGKTQITISHLQNNFDLKIWMEKKII